MACAVELLRHGEEVVLLERGERLGRKLSASGNGQGNVTNLDMGAEHYFTDDPEKLARILSRYGPRETVSFLESIGGIFLPDGRGRVYPAGRQASAVTDLLRGEISRLGGKAVFGARVEKIVYDGKFHLLWEGGEGRFDRVLLAAGGCAAPNFGTDGTAFALAEAFGHTVLPLEPKLVQLKCDPASVRGLKGIRVDAILSVVRKNKVTYACRGDVLFTESGISGDAAFKVSSHAERGDGLEIDLLPDVGEERLFSVLEKGTLLCVVNNGLGRALEKRAEGDGGKLLSLLKHFPLTMKGTLGFGYAQVTRGGIPLGETDEFLMSEKRGGLFLAGEMLNVDGECGGYNLHWAFSSGRLAAEGMRR